MKSKTNLDLLENILAKQDKILKRKMDVVDLDEEKESKLGKIIFKSKGKITESDERELTEEEAKLLEKFEENDREIDSLLEGVITQLETLKQQALGISTQIDTQGKLLKKLNSRVDVSWKKLKTKDSTLKKTLDSYRSSNRCCLDICLILIIVILLGAIVQVFNTKGYI